MLAARGAVHARHGTACVVRRHVAPTIRHATRSILETAHRVRGMQKCSPKTDRCGCERNIASQPGRPKRLQNRRLAALGEFLTAADGTPLSVALALLSRAQTMEMDLPGVSGLAALGDATDGEPVGVVAASPMRARRAASMLAVSLIHI